MSAQRLTYFHPRQGAVKVKVGFSWPSFFLGSLWAAVKGMWFPSFVGMLVLDTGLWFLTGYAEGQRQQGLALLGLVASIVYAYLRGRFGNRLLVASLIKRGYILRGYGDGSS